MRTSAVEPVRGLEPGTCVTFFEPQRRSLTRDDPSAFAAPAQFGPFRVLHQIGVGVLGPVFRTYEPDRDRLVAVKAFRIDITPEQAKSLADELSRAADAGLFHPSIVEPIAAGVAGSVAYNAEEYVAAESLDVAMRHYAPAAIDTVLPFITQLAGAIDFARAAGVGHGALHPRDVFMLPDEARVTGFGVVEALERVGFRAPVRRPYSPPERIAGSAWSTPADVFSLAAITYELLTGRRPAGVGAEIGSLTPGASDAAAGGLHAVLVRAMDADPSRRYPTALAFASALETAAHGKAVSEPAAGSLAAGSVAAALAAPTTAEVEPDISPAPVAASPVVRFPDPQRRRQESTAKRDDTIKKDDDLRKKAEEEEPDDDVTAEREGDVAHHQLTLHEMKQADEDIAVGAVDDRYSSDDFLLESAGATAEREIPADQLRSRKDLSPELRALDKDDIVVQERPSLLFDADDQRSPRKEEPPVEEPEVEPVVPAYAHAPTFGQYDRSPVESGTRSSNVPLALTLVLGITAGLGGGYWLWGRTTAPGATGTREFSEQSVGSPGSARSGASAPPATADTPSSTPTAGASVSKPSSAAPPAAEPRASAPPTVSEKPATAPERSRDGSSVSPPSSGSLVVRSTPSGAGVTVNGQWRGRTPLSLEKLPFARYDVRVAQPGYTAGRQSVTLSADDPRQSVAVRLQRTPAGAAGATERPTPARPSPEAKPQTYTGTVFVDSRPRGARVFIDGKPVGATPLSLPDVRIGTHVVRLELPDHQIWTSTATVTAGQQVRVTGSLERIQ